MIDTTHERIITLTQAAGRIPHRRAGRKAAASTLYRWTSRGCRGVLLEFVQIGATRCTSVEALDRFFARLTAAAANASGSGPTVTDGQRSTIRTSKHQQQAIDQAERELREAGI